MSYPATVTVWFVSTDDPAAVLRSEPKADRGFGRKLLSQINPAWPITPIGEFPLNRSSTPGPAEFYIAGYPGVAVVQTFVESMDTVTDASEVIAHLREALPATDTYVFAQGMDSDYAGFAHYTGTQVRRALAATREVVLEDVGLPDPFEAPYWAGEKAEQLGGITLPFEPSDLTDAAQEAWLGVPVSPEGPDVHVVGYAIDGRPEPKIGPAKPRTKSVNEVAARFADTEKDYDDYEVEAPDEDGHEFAQLADASLAATKRIGRGLSRRLKRLAAQIQDRIRHSDR
ncbi:hypothetical protein FPH17_11130 [Corynebacterium godavarianum]|uniref:PAC2 family protein n=1 Tax=Corynebacterium godavarianum TaxID=2054421 RepID=A0ABY3DY22_9CORY|nr:hypothetical protein [Corynebacterium godavarianum]MBL7285405.1 hypothetical protein [Corynebacterium godavarianum]TSJ70463.1 hypothetical protein FPH17_11130 [Corynebacterium godavarianum]